MDIFSFIECSNQTRSLSALFELLVNCAAEEGFNEVAYGAITYAESVRLPAHLPPAVAMNFPREWSDRYFERKYYQIDPVVRRAPTFSGPFVWDQLVDRCHLQSGEQLVLAEGREAGLKHGVSVPLFGPLGRVSVVSFASRFDDVDPLHRMSHLNIACLAVSHRVCGDRPASGAEHDEDRAIRARTRLSAVDCGG